MGSMMMPMMMMGMMGLSCMVAVGGGAMYMISTGKFPGTAAANGNTTTAGNTTTTGSLVINEDGSISQNVPLTSITAGGSTPGKGKFGEVDLGSGGIYVITDGIRWMRAEKGSKGAKDLKCKYNESVKSEGKYTTGETAKQFQLNKVPGPDGKLFYTVKNIWRDQCGTAYLYAKSCDNSTLDWERYDSGMRGQWWFLPDDSDPNKLLMQNRECAHYSKPNSFVSLINATDGRLQMTDKINASRLIMSPAT